MMIKKIITSFVVSLCLLIAAPINAEEDNIQFKENITSLGAVPENFTVIQDSIKYSMDLRNVTYTAYKENTQNIIRWNDRTSPVYYAVQPGFPKFSDDNRHAYIAYKEKNSKASIVVDWTNVQKFANADNFRFSPDGKRYVYRAAENEKQSLVIDGQPAKWYTGIPMNDEDNILFSPDSQHIAYVAYKENSCRVVVDDKEQDHAFQLIKDLRFSPDSEKIAYKGRIEKLGGGKEKWCAVVNGKKHDAYYKIFDFRFSPNSRHMAYSAFKNEKEMVLVLNGKEVDTHDQCGLPTFSPDSKKLAYAFKDGKDFHVMVNSNKSPGFPAIYKFYFSPDSSRYAYIAGKEKNWQCIVDGEAGSGPDYQSIEAFKFSSDSSRYLYGAVTENGGKIVIDGKPRITFVSVGEAYFSPDGNHTVYRARPAQVKGWTTIFDGEKKGSFYPAIGQYVFSKDSEHLAYTAMIDFDQNIMVVDGKEQCKDQKFNLIDNPYFSPDSNNVAYIAGHGEKGEFFLAVNGHILPTQYGGFFKDTPIVFDDDRKFHVIGMREPGPEFLLIEVEIPENVKLETDLSDL